MCTPGTEHTGRWTKSEHETFLKALRKYGKEWKKVAAMVKTRTVVQTRTHAQKYFQKLQKLQSSGEEGGAEDGSGVTGASSGTGGGGSGSGGTGRTSVGSGRKRNSAKRQRSYGSGGGMADDGYEDEYDERQSVGGGGGYRTHSGGHGHAPLSPAGVPGYRLDPIAAAGVVHTTGPRGYPIAMPSPAACGKRKHDELAAAEMLVQTASPSDLHAGELLSAMKTTLSHDKRPPSPVRGMDLKIINPDGLTSATPGRNSADPSTPWDNEVELMLDRHSPMAETNSKMATHRGGPSGLNPTQPTLKDETATADGGAKAGTAGEGDTSGDAPNKARRLQRRSALHEAILDGSVASVASIIDGLLTAAEGGDGPQGGGMKADTNGATDVAAGVKVGGEGSRDSVGTSVGTDSKAKAMATKTEMGASAGTTPVGPPNLPTLGGEGSAKRRASPADAVAEAVNKPDDDGFTPLMAAAALQFDGSSMEKSEAKADEVAAALCDLLVKNSASVTSMDRHGNTAMHWAALRCHSQAIRVLGKHGAPLDATNYVKETALHWASQACAITAAQELIKQGASTRLRDHWNRCPLDVAGFRWQHDPNHVEEPNPTSALASAPKSAAAPSIYSPVRPTQQQLDDRVNMRRALYLADPRSRTLVLSHQDCLGHLPRSDRDWECPERIHEIMSQIRDTGSFDPEESELEISSDFDKAPVEHLARAHSPEYIRFVNDLAKRVETMAKDRPGNIAPVPFTPQVQKHVKSHQGEAVKSATQCDTYFSIGSLRAARRAAGAVMVAVDRVLRGRNRNAFCVVRPPGHHAGLSGLLADAGSHGFCIFNNVAAGALHALEAEEHRCKRVAIIDIDVHHGNGTEEIVRNYPSPDRLLFFSIHLYDKEAAGSGDADAFEFYPGSGSGDDTAHNIINVPLMPLWRQVQTDQGMGPKHATRSAARSGAVDEIDGSEDGSGSGGSSGGEAGSGADEGGGGGGGSSGGGFSTNQRTGRTAFRNAIVARLVPTLRAFNPDLVLLSTGFDAILDDVGNSRAAGKGMVSGLDLTPEDFFWVTKEIQKVADMCCGGKIVSVLEGGYGFMLNNPCSSGHSMNQPGSFGQRTGRTAETEQPGPQSPNLRDQLSRTTLGGAAVQHLRALVDPYLWTTSEGEDSGER